MTRSPRIVAPSSAAFTATGKVSCALAQTAAPGRPRSDLGQAAGVVGVMVREDHIRHVVPVGPDLGESFRDSTLRRCGCRKTLSTQVTQHVDTRGGVRRVGHVYEC